jgi:glycine cleavage system aminomethyltransferase T
MDIAAQQRRTYQSLLDHNDGPFITERPPLFSPAAAAQDEANAKGTFGRFAQVLLPLEYTNWVDESLAHLRTCYLGDWTSLNKVTIRGPQALEFLGRLGMNSLSRFEIGQIKHHIQLDEHGWVASEGVLCHVGPEEFVYTAGSCDWLRWQFSTGDWDAEVVDVSPDRFIFGIQGPNSLSTLEQVTGDNLRDIGFSRLRPSRIGQIPVTVLRTGISGELGYELHGPAEHGNAIWSAVAEGGAQFGMPSELGWGPRRGVPAHDFLGRDALLAQAAAGGPARVLVGLVWHQADVLDVVAALFGDGDIPEQMDFPRRLGPSFDQVLAAGNPVGVSTGRTVSLHQRATISLCVIDRDHAAPGTPVTVVWGAPGTPQRHIRATVTALPFKPDHRRVDVTTL